MITIVGPGALGILFSVRLSLSLKGEVNLLDYKAERASFLDSKGVMLRKGASYVHGFPRVSHDPAEFGPQRFVIILVKAYQTQSVLPVLRKLCSDSTLVVTLQNGIGAGDILKRAVSPDNMALGITMQGATKEGEGRAVHAGEGLTLLGMEDGREDMRLYELAELLNSAGIETRVTSDIRRELWKKLLVNIGINPVTALACVRNGEILSHPELLWLQEASVKEAYSIMSKSGIELGMSISKVLDLVKDVCRKTSDNISSMLQDRLKQSETEIDFITGAVVREAKRLNAECPVNATIFKLIKNLSRRKWKFCDIKNSNL